MTHSGRSATQALILQVQLGNFKSNAPLINCIDKLEFPERASTMRAFLFILLGIAILIAFAVRSYRSGFTDVSYRYRLSVAVETDGRVHSGSSVIEVRYTFNPKWAGPEVGMYNEYWLGQAVLIDLGSRGALVAALGGDDYDRTIVRVDALAARAFQPDAARSNYFLVTLQRIRALSKMQGSADLNSNNLPPFIWFSDTEKLSSAKLLKPAEFASAIGDSTRLVTARVEMTTDPVVIDLDKKLPAYASLRGPPNNGNDYRVPSGAILGWRQFISLGKQ